MLPTIMVRFVFDILYEGDSSNGKGNSKIFDLVQTTLVIDKVVIYGT